MREELKYQQLLMPLWEGSYSELPFLNWILQNLEVGKKRIPFNPQSSLTYMSLIFHRANK